MAGPDTSATTGIAPGEPRAYLGRTQLPDVLALRAEFGAVTLQGADGLRIARALARMDDLHGVDLDPATYRDRPASAPKVGSTPARKADQLALPGMDFPALDWITTQIDLGLPVVRTAGQRIKVGRVEELRAELDRDYPVPVSVVLALDSGWLGAKHVASLTEELRRADRDVSLVFAAPFDPLNSVPRVSALRGLLRWGADAGRSVELLRTDLAGLPAVLEGAAMAAIGLITSTRHLGMPLAGQRRADYTKRQRSPLVFVPRLMHWQRASVLGALARWHGAGVTHCECAACMYAGRGLLRFADADHLTPTELGRAVREHDALALSALIRQIMTAADPSSELRHRRRNAAERAVAVSTSLDVPLVPPPAWLSGWD